MKKPLSVPELRTLPTGDPQFRNQIRSECRHGFAADLARSGGMFPAVTTSLANAITEIELNSFVFNLRPSVKSADLSSSVTEER
jgi:hypothetical protein